MDDRGQASIEWVGLVALVGAVLAAVVVLAFPGDGIGGAVVRQVHRALCVVVGGLCDLDRRPCVTASGATRDEMHVNVAIFRIGRDELILREYRSDGSVLVTYLGDTSLGLDVGAGVDGWVKATGIDLAAGSSARAALLASAGGGESWLFADAYAADAGMAALSQGHEPARGRRIEVVDRHGLEVELGARSYGERLKAAIGVDAAMVQASVVDERDGSRTHVLTRGVVGGLVLAGKDAGGRADGAAEERISIRTAADGRPLELTIVRTGQLEGAFSLPDQVQPIAERLAGGSQGGRRWVVEQRLDLTDALNREATREYVEAIGHPAALLGRATQALRDRIAAAGVTEARTYSVRSEDNGGAGGHAALGVKVGGGISDRTDEARLLDARVRGADGQWRTRTECLEAA